MRLQEIKKLNEMYLSGVRDTIKSDVSGAFERMEPSFWDDVNESVSQEYKAILSELVDILIKAFNCDESEQ